MKKNYYQVLDVDVNSTSAEIKKAYRKHASKFHPDKHDGDKFFEEKFKELQEAYDVLSNESKRNEYDRSFRQGNPETSDANFTQSRSARQERRSPEATHSNSEYTGSKATNQSPPSNPVNEKIGSRNRNILLAVVTGLILMMLIQLWNMDNNKRQAAVYEAYTQAGLTAQMAVDTEASTVAWSGSLVGVYTHTGTVKLTDGSFNVENGVVTSGSFTADLTQIAVTDYNYNINEGSTPEKLIGHLSSDDFFDVKNHPTATFVVTGATEDGKVKGDLTVRGTTNEEVLEEVSIDAESGSATASLTFDRQKYGVAWAHPLQDMVLENDIKLTVNVKAKG